ncbi:PTS sugar transporter subunit IIB [Amedibacillus sp. YH-ame6]
MKKIILLCNAGMSTSLLVNKMKEAADNSGFACTIQAHPISSASVVAKDADVILLGPQVRFALAKVQKECPNIPCVSIEPSAYGTMNGAAVIEQARKLVE